MSVAGSLSEVDRTSRRPHNSVEQQTWRQANCRRRAASFASCKPSQPDSLGKLESMCNRTRLQQELDGRLLDRSRAPRRNRTVCSNPLRSTRNCLVFVLGETSMIEKSWWLRFALTCAIGVKLLWLLHRLRFVSGSKALSLSDNGRVSQFAHAPNRLS